MQVVPVVREITIARCLDCFKSYSFFLFTIRLSIRSWKKAGNEIYGKKMIRASFIKTYDRIDILCEISVESSMNPLSQRSGSFSNGARTVLPKKLDIIFIDERITVFIVITYDIFMHRTIRPTKSD